VDDVKINFIIGFSDELSYLGGRQYYDWIVAELWQYKQSIVFGVLQDDCSSIRSMNASLHVALFNLPLGSLVQLSRAYDELPQGQLWSLEISACEVQPMGVKSRICVRSHC
jgi:hypothetical protein